MSDIRAQQALLWMQSFSSTDVALKLLAGDASFRRYFRVQWNGKQGVLMDAPPEQENVQPFLDTRDWLEQSAVRVPKLLALDVAQGFLLLEDLGDMTWAVALQQDVPLDSMLDDAWRQLHLLQASKPSLSLPVFDVARMQRECDLYVDWYLPKVAQVSLNEDERRAFHQAILPTLECLAALPQVPVHLDFHSRNLMLPDGKLPLVMIDFQDAVMGLPTYDVASLLYDCYQSYPESWRKAQSLAFFKQLPDDLKQAFDDGDHWHRMVRMSAFQRHLKALGIFARLAYRDGKTQFLDEIPLTRQHLEEELQVLDFPEVIHHLASRAPQKATLS